MMHSQDNTWTSIENIVQGKIIVNSFTPDEFKGHDRTKGETIASISGTCEK
jgi:hypothetical protein